MHARKSMVCCDHSMVSKLPGKSQEFHFLLTSVHSFVVKTSILIGVEGKRTIYFVLCFIAYIGCGGGRVLVSLLVHLLYIIRCVFIRYIVFSYLLLMSLTIIRVLHSTRLHPTNSSVSCRRISFR